MIPCYQICKDRNCSHWDLDMLDCDRLPDGCEYSVEHLVSDCENQFLDGKEHGKWCIFHNNGQRWWEWFFIDGLRQGLHREWSEIGLLVSEGSYVDGQEDGLWRNWNRKGQLESEGYYKNGRKEGYWYYNKDGRKEVKYKYNNGICHLIEKEE